MYGDLANRRCVNHWQREAAARCPNCGRFFCRECVTEHEDRLLCASCLRMQTTHESARSTSLHFLFRTLQITLSILLLWSFFYYMGKTLLMMPDEFHEGSIWQKED
jgi:hypothetical protein